MRRAVYDLNAQLTADYLTHGIVQLEYNSPVPANGDGTRSNNNNVGHQPGIVVQSVTLKPRNMKLMLGVISCGLVDHVSWA